MINTSNEINKIFIPHNAIFNTLKKYIKDNASVDTYVGTNISLTQNPSIIFQEARNELQSRSTTYDYTTRIMNYNIDIYCKKLPNSYEIIQELVVLVTQVMEEMFKMQGGLIAIIPISDSTERISFQANLRFTIRYIPNENRVY